MIQETFEVWFKWIWPYIMPNSKNKIQHHWVWIEIINFQHCNGQKSVLKIMMMIIIINSLIHFLIMPKTSISSMGK